MIDIVVFTSRIIRDVPKFRFIDSCECYQRKYFEQTHLVLVKVQIRPWCLSDADFVMDASQVLDPRKTIFVGGVPRPLRAVELALIMDRLYGGVCYAGIDVDPELKYPKGIFHGRKLVVGSRVGQALICSLTLEKLQTWMINVPRILNLLSSSVLQKCAK